MSNCLLVFHVDVLVASFEENAQIDENWFCFPEGSQRSALFSAFVQILGKTDQPLESKYAGDTYFCLSFIPCILCIIAQSRMHAQASAYTDTQRHTQVHAHTHRDTHRLTQTCTHTHKHTHSIHIAILAKLTASQVERCDVCIPELVVWWSCSSCVCRPQDCGPGWKNTSMSCASLGGQTKWTLSKSCKASTASFTAVKKLVRTLCQWFIPLSPCN